jgi:Cft2 family RNA processing exonuclease
VLRPNVDIRPEVGCDSVLAALIGLVQHLLVGGYPVAELVSRQTVPTGDANVVFDRVRAILLQSHFVDADAPVGETASGLRRLRVANPHEAGLHLPVRIRLDASSDPAAALLHAFVVLRVRYQTANHSSPIFRVEAAPEHEASIDALYLIGDAFTERYPVVAELDGVGGRIRLTLTGEPALISGGLPWARGDYVRSRDASLLLRPLREALEGADRPLAIPREARGALRVVRVRVPERSRVLISGLRWLTSLQQLADPVPEWVTPAAGPVGEHLAIDTAAGGYVVSTHNGSTAAILTVRSTAPASSSAGLTEPEPTDGTLAITLEALGGAREIGANCYYYAIGRRGLIVDAGFDATRDGWLGLPAFDQIPRLDAVVLTHAHLDHIGAVPVLLAAFPKTPVYCTRATFAVMFPQLKDSARVSAIRFEKTGDAPAISMGLVNSSIRAHRFRFLDYGSPTSIPEIPGLTLAFQDAGHIIGSACARFEFSGTSILHTGDISVEDQHLLRGMRVDDLAVDHLVIEGTYCNEPSSTREERRGAVGTFLTALGKRIDSGGSVLIPSFSLGRAQELVGMLTEWCDNTGRSVPIWTVGLVNLLNEVSASLPEFLPGLSGNPFGRARAFAGPRGDMPDDERRDAFARVFSEVAQQAPCAVIASHGMMVEGTGSYLIGRAILCGSDPRHAIFLCGYMDPRTPGFRLWHQREQATIDFGIGDRVPRKIPAAHIQFHRLSAHASYEELIEVASRTSTRTVTFIHGEGDGLDRLVGDLQSRFQAMGRALTVRAPAIGERFLVDSVRAPPEWTIDDVNETSASDFLGPGRAFDRKTGFAIGGLTADGKWALIPVGQNTATLALEHELIQAGRIERVAIRPIGGQREVVIDRSRAQGDLSRIQWRQPGKTAWEITARDPTGVLIAATIPVVYGAEVRPTRTTLDASAPVLEIEVGGTLDPIFEGVFAGSDGRRLETRTADWDPLARLLRIQLSDVLEVGTIENLRVSLRWPNGFRQLGPSLGSVTAEPFVRFVPTPARVGTSVTVSIVSIPRPSLARAGGQPAVLDGETVHFTPSQPGPCRLELGYQAATGDRDWREVGILDVRPAAEVDLPHGTDVARGLDLVVHDVDPRLHGVALALRIGSESHDRWLASGEPHTWSGDVPQTDPLPVAVVAPDRNWLLWTGTVRIYSGLEFNPVTSLTVTTADGALEAELAWVGKSRLDNAEIEGPFREAGFTPSAWVGNVLRVRGSAKTTGTREVVIPDGPRRIRVRLETLSDLRLHLQPPGPFSIGQYGTLCNEGGELRAGLHEIDGGPLTVEADRVRPLFDGLSVRIANGNRVQFLHPGSYSVALVAAGRRIAEITAEVAAMTQPPLQPAIRPIDRAATSTYDASVYAAELTPLRATAVLSPPGGPYRVVQTAPDHAERLFWDFIAGSLDGGARVVVAWPGLALGDIAGRLLRRLRRERPTVSAAHLTYPAPRGEIAVSEVRARTLRAQRVLCCAPAFATIDRGDAYRCVACNGRPAVRTDAASLWLQCPECAHEDRDLALTLVDLRSADVEILFADFRIARYLTAGSGSRYAGALARSVRCSQCHRLQPAFPRPAPWDRTELQRLLSALSSVWDPADRAMSIRRAARLAAQRTPRSRPSDVTRLEHAIRLLIDARVIEDGHAVGPLDRLEAGTSICCDKPLIWSPRRVSHLFLDIEELLTPVYPAPAHPELGFGQSGIRQLLALAD